MKTSRDKFEKFGLKLPPEQEAIRAKRFYPLGMFVEFPKEGIKSSIPVRLDKIACCYGTKRVV